MLKQMINDENALLFSNNKLYFLECKRLNMKIVGMLKQQMTVVGNINHLELFFSSVGISIEMHLILAVEMSPIRFSDGHPVIFGYPIQIMT